MRLSKTFWLILGIGISVIVLGVLGWVYLDQRGEQRRLNDSLADAQQTHSTLISQKGDLESQLIQSEIELAEAEALLDVVKASFPESVESIEYDEELFDIADDCNLDITSLTASEPSDAEVDSVTYSITSFVVVVEGEVDDMLDFIDTIATSEYFTGTTHFANATIEMVNIQVPQGEEEGEPSATINLVIYGYQGE
jgi:hypothetical protein